MAGKKRLHKKDDVAEYMSADELKSRFYKYLRDSGTFSNLQAQLRSKIVNEMFKTSSDSTQIGSKDDSESSLLPLQVGNWFVYDHMKRLGLEYSLSTFVSEAKLPYPKKFLSVKDILHVFGIDGSSSEYESIHSAYMSCKNGESFLYTFINIILKKTYSEISSDAPSKAEPARNNKSSLLELNPSKVFYETFNDFEPSFKEATSNIESAMYKQLQLEKDKHEKEIQQLRQKLLLELDTLYAQEQQARVDLEQRKMKLVHEQELLDLQKEKFKIKEVELNGRLKGLELEAEKKVNTLKASLSQKYEELDEREMQLNEKQQRLEKDQAELKAKHIQSETFEAKFMQLQHSYKTLQNEYAVILNENEKLQVELKRVSDYSIIKEELDWKSKKLEHFEKELVFLRLQLHEERSSSLHTIQKLQQQMTNEMSMPHLMSQYITSMQKDQPPNDNEKSADCENKSSQQYKELLTRIEDQTQDIQELHRLIHNLHYQPPIKQNHAACVESLSTKEPPSVTPKSSPAQKSLHRGSLKQKLHEETNKKIQELIRETDVMEQKYLEYMCSRPNLCPNIYIPYNAPSSQLHLDVETPLTKDKLQFQNLSNPFKNLDFASKTCDSKFMKPWTKISNEQEYVNRAQDFFKDGTSSQSYGVMPTEIHDVTAKQSKDLSTNQALFYNLPSLQSKYNFTLNKTVENEPSMNGEKSASSGALEIKKITHNDVLNSNISSLSDHAINNLLNEPERLHAISQLSTSANQNPDMILTSSEQTVINDRVEEHGSGDRTTLSEKHNTKISNDEGNLHNKNGDDPSKNTLKIPDAQTKGDATFKLDNSVFNQEKLPSDNLEPLKPLAITEKIGGSASNDFPIDLDAVWKQQTKTSIFKINSNTKNVFTVSSNESELPSIKNLPPSENKARRKLAFDEISKPGTISLLTKDMPILNSSSEKNVTQPNTVFQEDMPHNLTSVSEKDASQLDSVLKKDVLLVKPISEKQILNLVSQEDASRSNPTSEKDTCIFPLKPESMQKSDFSQEILKKPNSDNMDNNVQLDKQTTSKSISSEQPTSDIPNKGSKHSSDKSESKKNGSSLHCSDHTLEARNSISEINSSELDEKDSNNPNDSELNLSAGSELEQAKDEDDGW